MNYANPEQDVIGSYGEENVKFLKETAAKYDPTGFFQQRVPGGWKKSAIISRVAKLSDASGDKTHITATREPKDESEG
nr:FAD binding domain-containing protein [Colletotrichum truncatum]KAF6784367.1 FAD binding domain-containing protein [Colletotrichum truncatum]